MCSRGSSSRPGVVFGGERLLGTPDPAIVAAERDEESLEEAEREVVDEGLAIE